MQKRGIEKKIEDGKKYILQNVETEISYTNYRTDEI